MQCSQFDFETLTVHLNIEFIILRIHILTCANIFDILKLLPGHRGCRQSPVELEGQPLDGNVSQV